MSEEDLSNLLLNDIYAVSGFGTLEGMLEDYQRLQGSSKSEPQHKIEKTPSKLLFSKRHQRQNRRVIITAEDDEMPRSRGRGAASNALKVATYGYEIITRELREIGSANLRNENIEAYFDEQYEDISMSDSDEGEHSSDAAFAQSADGKNVAAATARRAAAVIPTKQLSALPRAARTPAPPADVQPPPTASKARKQKKTRNAVLLGCLAAQANKSAPPIVLDKAVVAAAKVADSTSAAVVENGAEDEDDGDGDDGSLADALFVESKIEFASGDSANNSEVEVESRRSYTLDDEQPTSSEDDLQTSVGALSDVSTCSSAKDGGSCSGKRSSASSRTGYHGTSRRNRLATSSPLIVHQNPVLGGQEVYTPQIRPNSFTFNQKEFPKL